jgi:hypothetical protein
MADKPAWLKGNSDVEWSYNVIAEWLSSGIAPTPTRPGDDVLGELQKLIYAALTTARQAAAQDAYEQAAVIAGTYLDYCRESLTEDVGQRSAAKIRALAAAEAGKEEDKSK